MILIAVSIGDESIFRLLLSLLEEVEELSIDVWDADRIYRRLCESRVSIRWYDFLLRTTGAEPQLDLILDLGTGMRDIERWIMDNSEVNDKCELEQVIEKALQLEKYKLVQDLIRHLRHTIDWLY